MSAIPYNRDTELKAAHTRIRHLEGVLRSVAQCQTRRCDPCSVCVALLRSVTTEKTKGE